MKYLDLLARVRECKIKAEAAANALSKASNSGNVREKETAKQQYFRYEHEYKVRRSEAMEMIRTSQDKELMRALMLRRVELMPWDKIIRSICTNQSEMDMRADVYQYIKANHGKDWGNYSDCF